MSDQENFCTECGTHFDDDDDHEGLCLRCLYYAIKRQRDELLAACEAQAKLVAALEGLLMAYRLGRQPTERVFNVIDRKAEIIAQVRAVIEKVKA